MENKCKCTKCGKDGNRSTETYKSYECTKRKETKKAKMGEDEMDDIVPHAIIDDDEKQLQPKRK